MLSVDKNEPLRMCHVCKFGLCVDLQNEDGDMLSHILTKEQFLIQKEVKGIGFSLSVKKIDERIAHETRKWETAVLLCEWSSSGC